MRVTDRKYYGLTFCQGGRIVYHQQGREIVSDAKHAVFLPKGGCYTLSGEETGSFPMVNFTCANPYFSEITAIPLDNPTVYLKEMEEMRDYFQAGRHGKVLAMLYNMLDRLAQQSEPDSLVAPALKYMAQHYHEVGLSNAVLAAQMNVSEVHFRQLFKKACGTTPHQYLLRLRLEKAKQLLADPSLTAAAVGERCGFANAYHFSKAFKDGVGVSPLAYRKELSRIQI